MKDRSTSLFVERRTYRRRRLIDAARLLPVLGTFLWMMPLLWAMGASGAETTSAAMLYIFGVWLLMVVGSACLTRWLGEAEDADDDGAS